MKFFSQLIRTAVNLVELPVEVVKDVVTLGGSCTGQTKTYTQQQLEKLAEEAQED